MAISISDHFTYPKLLRFAFPSVLMMIFTSLYTIVDGLFVSNLVGASAFASLNLIWPAIGMLGAFGFMIGAGGTALVSKTLGEGDERKASSLFTMLLTFEVLLGIVVSAITIVFIEPISYLLGANDALIADCIAYGVPLLAGQCFFFLSTTFQSFLVAAGKPKLGLYLTLAAGMSNMVLDFVFIRWLHMGIAGAAWATLMNWMLSALLPLYWFWHHKDWSVHLSRFSWDFPALAKACVNGSSEMVTNLSSSLVLMLYNWVLMQRIGADGVVAYGVIQYIFFLFASTFFGYSMASAPCIGYQYGANNRKELHNLYHKSMIIVLCASIVLTLLAEGLAHPLSMVFVSSSPALMEMTTHAIRIFSICFLMLGINTFASGFFTALNNGLVSAVLSFLRTFVFQVGAVLILPQILGTEGIWGAQAAAELLSLAVSLAFLFGLRRRYGY